MMLSVSCAQAQTPREQIMLNLVGRLNLDFKQGDKIRYWTDGNAYIFPCSTNPNEWILNEPPAANIVYFNVAEWMGVDLGGNENSDGREWQYDAF